MSHSEYVMVHCPTIVAVVLGYDDNAHEKTSQKINVAAVVVIRTTMKKYQIYYWLSIVVYVVYENYRHSYYNLTEYIKLFAYRRVYLRCFV